MWISYQQIIYNNPLEITCYFSFYIYNIKYTAMRYYSNAKYVAI